MVLAKGIELNDLDCYFLHVVTAILLEYMRSPYDSEAAEANRHFKFVALSLERPLVRVLVNLLLLLPMRMPSRSRSMVFCHFKLFDFIIYFISYYIIKYN